MSRVQPDTIMRHVYGLFPGLALLSGIRLDLFTRLEDRPMDAAGLARILKVNEQRLAPLLYALAAAGLLTVDHGCFSNTRETAEYLGTSLYKDHIRFLVDKILNSVVKTDRTITQDAAQAEMDWYRVTANQEAAFFNGQYYGSIRAGEELARTIDFPPSQRILDGACGTGGMAIGLCRARPDLRITSVDLPAVIRKTRERLTASGLADRICLAAADLVRHPPPGRFDTVILRSFLQVLSPAHAQQALTHINKAMRRAGRLVITGYFVDDSRLFPARAVFHNLVFLNLYENGRAHTENEHRTWLETAGFGDIAVQYEVFSDGAGMVTAHRI